MKPIYQTFIKNRWLAITFLCIIVFYTNSFSAGALATIELSPSTTSIQVDQLKTFTCVGKDSEGDTVIFQSPMAQYTGGNITVNHDPATGITTVSYTATVIGNHYIEVWDAAVTGPPGDPGAIWGSADITNSTDSPQIACIIVSPSSVNMEASTQ